ncbi:uncharacterized protein LOC125491431 [Plutella xylostella]|uniref:uncharacterized protein LOC125491431 n=1 Tax=Plutella xylostella TaxID=51655 RepID=UPI0020322A96|nr:uncharacterized protein LOC125491431 [Plutella xylostella]
MAKISVGTLTVFNHEVHDWIIYKDRLEQWFLANDVELEEKTGNKRRAILLSSLAEQTYRLLRDLALPKEVGTLTYTSVITLLDSHFQPKKCGFAERSKFHGATQSSGESLAEWAARVRGLATHCAFGEAVFEDAIRDRFVLGLAPGPERDKLFTLEMEELTLSKALAMAEGVRCAREGSRQTAPGAAPPDPLHVFKMAAAPRTAAARAPGSTQAARDGGGGSAGPVTCSACGYEGHQLPTCKFTRYKCKKCGVKGHLRRVCPGKNLVRQHFVECSASCNEDDVLTM